MRIIHPRVRQNLLRKIIIFLILALVVGLIVVWRHNSQNSASGQSSNSTTSSNTQTTPAQPSFNKQQYSVNDPASIWVVVNKGRVLPSSYAPSPSVPADSYIRSDTAAALDQLIAAAAKDAAGLKIISGYRSYSNQTATYNAYVKSDGVAKADTYSARPGHSEHQTGLAADLGATSGKCNLQICFGDMPEGKWLAANAYKFGFIIRYQSGKESLTGYQYEPWHVRYVGKDLAAEINKTGQTLEQFFSLPVYTTYPAAQYQLKSGN